MLDNTEKIEYLQKIFGYSLTTETNLETCFFFYGVTTRNGKSTLVETISYMLGNTGGYSINMKPESLAAKQSMDSKKASIFNEDEAREFVKAVLKEPHHKKKVKFSIMIFLGLRKAEICGLTWGDIDFENKTPSVRKNSLYFPKFGIVTKETKTKSSKRTIRLPDQMLTILTEYKAWYDEQKILYGDLWDNKDNLFLQDTGKPLHPSSVNSWLRKFNIQHGFKHIPPHSIRHTCITMQITAGVPIKTVSTRAGHANERITLDIYTHSTQQQDEKAAEIYNNYLLS
jgi:integrase